MSSAVSDSPPSTAHDRAEFTWEIDHFSTTTDVQKSPIFSSPVNSKVRFVLKYYPSFDMAGEPGKFVAFKLCLDSLNSFEAGNQLVKPYVRYRIAILNRNGTKYFSQECQNRFAFPYNTPHGAYGGYQIKRDYLYGLLINDKLTVYCEVDHSCIKNSLVIPLNPIQDDFRSLLESGKYSDVILLIDGKSLSVHKNILVARSVVFAAMFEHDLEEKRTNRVEISDVEVEVMELVLGYIYTGQIPELNDYATELFVAADKYQLNVLRKSCETYLINHLTPSTVASILILADMHQASDLKEYCLDYITENVKQVVPTEGWKVLLTKSDLMQELVSKIVDKQDILNEKVKTLECELKVQKKLIPSKVSIKSNSEHSCKGGTQQNVLAYKKICAENLFQENIASLFGNGKLSDAFLVGDDLELSVHRNILCARSKVFEDLFETQTRVQLDNISVESCKQFLRYIYTGQVDLIGNEFASHLLEASHKYALHHLKAICEQFLSSSIEIDSVVDKFVLADSSEANHLKRICFDFICENVKQVIQTEGWKVLKQTRPQFAFELFEQVTEKMW